MSTVEERLAAVEKRLTALEQSPRPFAGLHQHRERQIERLQKRLAATTDERAKQRLQAHIDRLQQAAGK